MESTTQENFAEKLAQAAQALGFQQSRMEPADRDEEYGVFSSGDHASKAIKRIPKPSYSQQEEVAKVLLKAKPSVYGKQASMGGGDPKRALIDHHGLDESEIEEEYSQKDLDEKLLPLIARELPDQWEIKDVSSAEVARMRRDFLLDT